MSGNSPIPPVTRWVEEYYGLIYRYAYRLSGSRTDAEDLTQQAFLKAHASQDQLRNPVAVKSWLCTIVRNTYLKTIRSGGGSPPVLLDSLADQPAPPPPNADIDEELLQQALSELPEEFRTPIVLYYFEEFSYREIADQMQTPLGTVMSRLSRAKQFLRDRLGTQLLAEETDVDDLSSSLRAKEFMTGSAATGQ